MLHEWLKSLRSDESILAGLLGAADKNGASTNRSANIKATKKRIEEAKKQIVKHKKQERE